jgi:hypothetical protein
MYQVYSHTGIEASFRRRIQAIQYARVCLSEQGVIMTTHFQAKVEDRTIYFELTPAESYQANKLIPIHWEESGQVFVGELMLDDLAELDWTTG